MRLSTSVFQALGVLVDWCSVYMVQHTSLVLFRVHPWLNHLVPISRYACACSKRQKLCEASTLESLPSWKKASYYSKITPSHILIIVGISLCYRYAESVSQALGVQIGMGAFGVCTIPNLEAQQFCTCNSLFGNSWSIGHWCCHNSKVYFSVCIQYRCLELHRPC